MNQIHTPPATHPSYRPDIDGLRAIAVLAVLGFHAFPEAVKGGFIGVDIFFVISGYLITGILLASLDQARFSLATFYARRIRRIFPALLLVLATTLAAGWFLLLTEEYRQLARHVTGGAGFLSNILLWRESGYFDNIAETKPLLHLWSLGVEEQFYILWPLLLWASWKLRLRPALIAGIVLLLSFALNIAGLRSDPSGVFYLPHTRIWELAAGALIACAAHAPQGITARALRLMPDNLRAAAGLALIIACALLVTHASAFPGWWAALPVAGTALVISAGPQAWANRTLLSARALVAIGLISFPLYLWHWPLLSFARITESDTPSLPLRAALVLLAFPLAWATYRWIETPIRTTPAGRRQVFALLALMALCGGAGYLVIQTGGIESRRVNSFAYAADAAINAFGDRLAADPDLIEHLRLDRQDAIRAPYCHLNKQGQTFAEYRETMDPCLRMASDKPNVLVVGDSHGGELYAALQHALGDRYHFQQATGAGCTPDVSYAGKPGDRCHELLRFVVTFTAERRPQAVVLAGVWRENQFDRLGELIAELKASGTAVHITSPPASLTADANKIIRRGSLGRTQAQLSERFFDRATEERARRLQAFTLANGAKYLDRMGIQCPEPRRCRLLAQDGSLLIWDYGHLVRAGIHDLGVRMAAAGVSFP